MNDIIAWIAAEAEGPEEIAGLPARKLKRAGEPSAEILLKGLWRISFLRRW